MSKRIKPENPPAFPAKQNNMVHGLPDGESMGMSLLDYFAGQALVGALETLIRDSEYGRAEVSRQCYNFAEAMLAERQRRMAK